MATTRAYGWLPDRPDRRDFRLEDQVALPAVAALPPRLDLRQTGALADPIFDQGQLGSCTANAIAAALLFTQRANQLPQHITPARLALYYWERLIEGTTSQDAGAELRDGLKVVAGKPGYVDESEWPYDVSRFADAPPASVQADAARDHATKYLRVSVSAMAMKQALAAGFPVVVGFDVFSAIESSEVAQTGLLPMPAAGEQAIGGHAVLLVGYDDVARRWLCRNSWGDAWGQQGYFTMPYGYLDSPLYATDFWTILQEVEGGDPTPTPGPAPGPAPDPLHELADQLRKFIQAIDAWMTRHHL